VFDGYLFFLVDECFCDTNALVYGTKPERRHVDVDVDVSEADDGGNEQRDELERQLLLHLRISHLIFVSVGLLTLTYCV
jgi:hypothetical protein